LKQFVEVVLLTHKTFIINDILHYSLRGHLIPDQQKKKVDGRFFSFRTHGIIQKPKPEGEKPSVSSPEHTLTGDDIFIPSDEVIDFSEVGTEAKDSVHNTVNLEDAKIIDRENEGILEFDQQGSVVKEKKKKPKIKRVTTIRDYVKKLDEKEAASMDYIDIDDNEPGKRVFPHDKKPKKESDEPLPELDYMAYDDDNEDDVKEEEAPPEPKREEEGPKGTIDCPHCSETIEIPSSKRPVTLKCSGCGKKGVLRI